MVKLADLGGAKVIRQSILVTMSQFGTSIYMSPEMFKLEDYSFPTDIWYRKTIKKKRSNLFIKIDFFVRSLGCVLYELTFLDYAHKNRGKEHPKGGSQLFSASIKRFIFQQ